MHSWHFGQAVWNCNCAVTAWDSGLSVLLYNLHVCCLYNLGNCQRLGSRHALLTGLNDRCDKWQYNRHQKRREQHTAALVHLWFEFRCTYILLGPLFIYQHGRPDSHAMWTMSSVQGLLFDVCRQRDFSGAVWMRWGADVCWLALRKLFQAWEKVWEMVQKCLCDEGMKGNARSVLQDSLGGGSGHMQDRGHIH